MIFDQLFESRSARLPITGIGVDQDAAISAFFGAGRETTSGVDVTPELSLTLSAVYAAVRLLSWTPAQLPLRVFERLPNGDKEPRPDHPVDRLTQTEPNPEMPAMLFRENGQKEVLQWGRSLSFIERAESGEPLGLWPMRRKQVVIDRLSNGQKFYDIHSLESAEDWPLPPTAETVLFPEQVLDVPNLGGQSVVTNAREQMGEAIAAQRLGGGFFAGGSLFAFALKLPGKAGDPAKLRENLEAVHGDRRKIAVLESGAELEKYGMPLVDAQFLESRQFYITEVARWYGIPPHKLRDLMRATFSNIEQQKLEWHEDLIPWLIRWEQELNRKLFPVGENGRFFVEHNVEGLLRGDTAARFEAYGHALAAGWMNRNQVRQKENQPNIGPKGDMYTVQAGTINLEDVLNPPEPPEPPQHSPNGVPAEPAGNEQEDRSLLRKAATEALTEATRTAVSREAAELRVLAEEPGEFLDRLDKFYKRWPAKMAGILRPCQPVCFVARRDEFDPVAVAADHCRTAHAAILGISGEVKPAELHDRIVAEVAKWEESIPATLAATVFGGSSDE